MPTAVSYCCFVATLGDVTSCSRTRLFVFRLHDLTLAVRVPPRASAHQFRWRHPVAPGGGWRVGTRQWVASESLVPACAVLDVATRWRALFSAFVASCVGPTWTWVATHACRPLRTAIKIHGHASSCTHPLANTRVCLCVARESCCSVRVLLERKCTTQTSTLTMWLSGKNQSRRSRGSEPYPRSSCATTDGDAVASKTSTPQGSATRAGTCLLHSLHTTPEGPSRHGNTAAEPFRVAKGDFM